MKERELYFHISDKHIQSVCGKHSSRKGETYRKAGKVILSLLEASDDHWVYEATVKDNDNCQVTIEIRSDGTIAADCVCSLHFSFEKYCKHIAAALHQIKVDQQVERNAAETSDMEKQGFSRPLEAQELQLVHHVLELFKYQPHPSTGLMRRFDNRTTLSVEFHVTPYLRGSRSHLLGIELRIGPGKRYAVPDIREFLSRVEQSEPCAFSRHFTYDPELHCFNAEDHDLFIQLMEVCRNEKLQREIVGTLYTGEVVATQMLLIPPFAWNTIATKLAKASLVILNHEDRQERGIQFTDEALPLQFIFDQREDDSVQLEVKGLRNILILDMYGIALSEGCFFKLKPDMCKRLNELQKMMQQNDTERIRIPPQQMETFFERVIPGFMSLGDVRIAQAISDRVVQLKLNARIYLDRVRERLLVGIEFQYGDIVINPLEHEGSRRGENRILIREGEKELRILDLMDSAGFAKTEGGYYVQDEEKEFYFLYHIVPLLEKLARLYATTAVKERLYTDHPPPRISVNLDERTHWLEFRFQMDGIPESEIKDILHALEEKRTFHRLRNGALLPLETAAFQEMVRFLNEVKLPKGEILDSRCNLPAASSLHLLDAYHHDPTGIIQIDKSIRRLIEHLRDPECLYFTVPEQLAPVLRDYQLYGFHWFKTLAHYRFGGILADDMGLGKTIQSIAFLVSELTEIRDRQQPALIVSPASLTYNWRNELHKFTPEIRTIIVDGTPAERSSLIKEAKHYDVLIVSYPLLRRDIQYYREHAFHTLILDEAQTIKNYTTQTARAVKALRAKYRFALTGTPIENNLEELWSIFDAVFPGLFPNRKAFNELSRETIAKRARPFLLRRMKRDVLQELPEKIETLQVSELLSEQKKLYAAYLAKLRHEMLEHLDADDFQKNRIRILAGLTRLRQICCHPALFVEGYKGQSAKFKQLLETIEDCLKAGKRLLVFSQFTEMLKLISRELGYRGVSFFYLDGSTPASERFEQCSRFNEGERDLFLISLKAGGTGLNLTGADTVILYDLWWNPAVEQQAEDRAHRIGQKKVVHVIRFIAQGTIEEKMFELQQKKKNLIAEVIHSGEEAISALTEQDFRELLSIE